MSNALMTSKISIPCPKFTKKRASLWRLTFGRNTRIIYLKFSAVVFIKFNVMITSNKEELSFTENIN